MVRNDNEEDDVPGCGGEDDVALAADAEARVRTVRGPTALR